MSYENAIASRTSQPDTLRSGGVDPRPQPSTGPAKNEPTPERAKEEKARQAEKADRGGGGAAVPEQQPPSES